MISKLNKIYTVIIIVFILMSVAFYAYWLYNSKKSQIIETPQTQTQIPVSSNPLSSTITETVDLAAIKSRIESSGKIIYQTSNVKGYLLEDNDKFEISSSVNDEINFFIAIKAVDNVQVAINKAEEDFLSILGINKNQACQLKVHLEMSPEAIRPISGDYQLSFCPPGTVPSQ